MTFSILFFLYRFLKPYKLGSISAMMAIGSVIPLMGMPLYQAFKFVRTPGRMRKVKKARAGIFAAVAIVTVAGVLLIPTPLRVQGSLVLTAAKPDQVYSEVPGRVVELKVRDGEAVKKDQILAVLSNPEKQRELIAMQDSTTPTSSSTSGTGWSPTPTTAPVRASTTRWPATSSRPSRRSPTRSGSSSSSRPATALRWACPTRRRRAVHQAGQAFCEVGDPHMVEAHMILDQSDIDLVHLNRKAWVKIYGDSETTFRSTVSESPSETATSSRPSFRTTAEARSRPSRTPRPASTSL